MPKRVVAISDTHSGHLVGLTPPIWHVDMERMPNIGALQRSMWNWYESVIEALQPIDVLLFLGDAIDGKGQRSGSTELLITDLGEQCEMASYAIKTAKAKSCAMVYGTPYHASPYGEDYEKLIAEEVGATINGHSWVEVNGVIFDLKHKIGGSTIPHGRYTAAAKEKLWADLWKEHGQGYASDIILRGHVHYHGVVGGERRNDGRWKKWRSITMPSLQGPGSKYGVRQCSGIVDVGLLEFNIDDNGGWEWNAHMMDMEIAKPELVRL